MTERLDVVAIGNAIVDVLARVEDDFLGQHGIEKGIMQLIDTDRAASLYEAMPMGHEISGGSAANTVAGLAALGAKTAFVGRVRDDQLGRIFAHDIRALGAEYDGPMVNGVDGVETGRCLVMVTPDGERSMSTYLGISAGLCPEDIDVTLMSRADWLYLEGYLFDSPDAKAAYIRAIEAVKAGGGQVAFTVSDPFCVERHREDMKALIADHVDLLFANKAELLALYETEDFEAALERLSGDVHMAAVTMSGDGAVVLQGGVRTEVPAEAVEVVDSTGAGDMFAAGFLSGLARGRAPAAAARMGCVAAAEVISHLGARPEEDLKARMAAAGI
jgi:sugar/nucleoside kinase (ribokinase family)